MLPVKCFYPYKVFIEKKLSVRDFKIGFVQKINIIPIDSETSSTTVYIFWTIPLTQNKYNKGV